MIVSDYDSSIVASSGRAIQDSGQLMFRSSHWLGGQLAIVILALGFGPQNVFNDPANALQVMPAQQCYQPWFAASLRSTSGMASCAILQSNWIISIYCQKQVSFVIYP